MKCLLCGNKFDSVSNLREHYINFHRVDPSNIFFKKFFSQHPNKSVFKNCALCNEFITTSNYQKAHNFVKHYQEGKEELVEDKPTDIIKTLSITKYQILYSKHSDYYNFSDSESVVNEFLSNVKVHFKVTGPVQIKASFTIENYQPPVSEEYIPLYNTRYWTTDVYPATYFNSFVFYNLRQDITKRVIANGLSGSSWMFSKFIQLSVSVYNNNNNKLVL